MSNLSLERMDIDFDDWQSTRITLSQPNLDWATQISQTILDEAQQWQTFLRAMALGGFCQWLEERPVDLPVVCDSASADGAVRTLPPSVDTLYQVNHFRLCLLTIGSLSDEIVALPQSAFEGSQPAHLYVLLEVLEEFDQVIVHSALRYDQLRTFHQQTPLSLRSDNTYPVPVQLFDTSPEQLLLYLTCLNPAMLMPEPEAALSQASPAVTSPLSTRLMNAGRWLNNQLDAVAESLAWVLLPSLSPEPALAAMRSPTEEIEALLSELGPAGVSIPALAKGAYIDLQPQGLAARLYAVVWPVFESATLEWSLFLFLGPVPGEHLPPDIRLTIRDAHGVLAEQTLIPNSPSTFLYAQVLGTWQEQFTPAIALPDGFSLTLPTFAFNPGE